jgi:PAS domain S-box-containing protein
MHSPVLAPNEAAWREALDRLLSAELGGRDGVAGAAEVLERARELLSEVCPDERAKLWLAEAVPGESPPGWAVVAVEKPAALTLWIPEGHGSGALRFLRVASVLIACAREAQRAAVAEGLCRQVVDPMPVAVVVRRGPGLGVAHANAAALTSQWAGTRGPLEGDGVDVVLGRLVSEVARTVVAASLENHRMPGVDGQGAVAERFANVRVEPVRGPDGQAAGAVLFGMDVTEQVQLRKIAEAAEDRQAQLIQSINAIVWEAPEGQSGWSYVSDGAVAILGYPVARWAEPRFWRRILHEDDRARVVTESGAAQGDRDLEYRVLAADGRVVWMHDAVRVIRDPEGRVISQRGVMLDITLRKEAEASRARLHADMVDFQKLESLGVMAGGIAHDFNNVLTVILGNASLAAMRLPDHSPARSSIDDLIANAQRAADLTRQLLAYSGRAQLSTETLELGAVIRELRGLLASVVPKRAVLEMHVGPQVPAVEGDRAQLQQVVMNLATNAAEALGGGNGTVCIRTAFEQLSRSAAEELRIPPGGYVVLTVEDEGSGMEEATRRRVFDPFFTTKAQGRGLGLAAVHGIVKGHGGTVEVRSTPQVGTTVRVYLPASQAVPVARSAVVAPIRTGSGLVLVIDDESEVRATARAMLEALGYDVVEAEDGRSGLLRFDRCREELRVILLDMTMPVMSGEEVLRELVRRGATAGIVLSTGFSEIDARSRGMSEGLSGFLQKPYTLRQLADIIGRAATRGSQPQ